MKFDQNKLLVTIYPYKERPFSYEYPSMHNDLVECKYPLIICYSDESEPYIYTSDHGNVIEDIPEMVRRYNILVAELEYKEQFEDMLND